MNEIQKPITLIRAEFIEELTTLINASSLPPFILEPILKDIYRDVAAASLRQLEQDRAAYKNSVLSHTNTTIEG